MLGGAVAFGAPGIVRSPFGSSRVSGGPIRLDHDEVALSADHCIKCNVCNTVCPVLPVTDLFPGPKYVGPQAERFRTPGPSDDASLDYCSGCGICTLVCPQGVHIAEINARARAPMKQQRGIPLRDHLVARPSVEGRLATPVAPLANMVLSNRAVRLLTERMIGIDRGLALYAAVV